MTIFTFCFGNSGSKTFTSLNHWKDFKQGEMSPIRYKKGRGQRKAGNKVRRHQECYIVRIMEALFP